MSDTFDEQIRQAFDALADRMRATVADHVNVAVSQLSDAVAADRASAVEAATRRASETAEQAVRQQLAAEFAEREKSIRETENSIRETTRAEAFEAGLEQARAEARALQLTREAEVQAVAAAAAERVAQLEAELTALRSEDAERLDAALTAARADAAAAASQHEQVVLDLRAELEQVHMRGVEALARHADQLADIQVEAERLLTAVRTLDASTSLSQTLDALAAAAQAEAERTVVFLVRGETLRAWTHKGFEVAPQGAFDIALSDAGALAAAVRGGAVQKVHGSDQGRPAFAGAPVNGALVAVPLTMNGQVIAVLCGERAGAADAGDRLAVHYEVLARHAARVLESLTALRLAQLGAQPAHASSASPPQ